MVIASCTSICDRNHDNLCEIVNGYAHSDLIPDLCVFVLDRCSFKTETELQSLLTASGIRYVILKAPWSDSVFAAGRPRDYAIDQVVNVLLPDVDVFVFLDGDCIPSKKLFQEHLRVQSKFPEHACMVNGRRVDTSGELDPRQVAGMFDDEYDTVVTGPHQLYTGTMVPCCFGCNVSLNRPAIANARTLNRIVLGDVDRCFASAFDGRWGGEDPFLAASLYRTGAVVINLNMSSHVLHVTHDSAHKTREHVPVLVNSLERLRTRICSGYLTCTRTQVVDTGAVTASKLVSEQARILCNNTCTDDSGKAILHLSPLVFVQDPTHMASVLNLLRDREMQDQVKKFKCYLHELRIPPTTCTDPVREHHQKQAHLVMYRPGNMC